MERGPGRRSRPMFAARPDHRHGDSVIRDPVRPVSISHGDGGSCGAGAWVKWGIGQWAVGSGAVGSGQWQWAVGSGQWHWQWAVGSGQWAVGSGKSVQEKSRQVKPFSRSTCAARESPLTQNSMVLTEADELLAQELVHGIGMRRRVGEKVIPSTVQMDDRNSRSSAPIPGRRINGKGSAMGGRWVWVRGLWGCAHGERRRSSSKDNHNPRAAPRKGGRKIPRCASCLGRRHAARAQQTALLTKQQWHTSGGRCDYFLRCRIFERMRRFLRPSFRRPLPRLFRVPTRGSVADANSTRATLPRIRAHPGEARASRGGASRCYNKAPYRRQGGRELSTR